MPIETAPGDNEKPATGVAKAGQQFVEQLLRLGVDGFGPFSSAEQSAREALKGRSKEQAIKVLIRNHCLVAGRGCPGLRGT